MPIEVKCEGCGAKLRLDEKYAGRNAKCPKCENIFRVPNAGTAAFPAASAGPNFSAGQPAKNWMVRLPDGQVYGPASDAQANQWISEGRLTADCYVCHEGESNWRPAASVFSQLARSSGTPSSYQPSPSALAPSGNPFAEDPGAANPYVTPKGGIGRGYTKPHRGPTILTFGILGILCCALLAPAAWVMGQADIKDMDSGRMDSSGRGLTQAGMIIGIIGTVLILLQLGFVAVAIIAEAA